MQLKQLLVAATTAATIGFAVPGHAVQYQIVYVPVTIVVNGKTMVVRRPVVRPVTTTTNPGLLPGLAAVSDATWDETAVRKVLHIFTYGGLATDAQITNWANMKPADAIKQMLTLGTTNNLLSPAEASGAFTDGTLLGIARRLSTDAALIPEQGFRDEFKEDNWDARNLTWIYASTLRGLNPFRQKMGFYETNYHMAVNHRTQSAEQMWAYYDRVMAALENNGKAGATAGYETVMTTAALSASVARQYGHEYARYYNDSGECDCNDDFAREYHQLFFGILGGAIGSAERDYHENTTIKNTAKMLTDLQLHHPGLTRDTDDEWWAGQDVTYGSEYHPTGNVEVLRINNTGSNAQQRFNMQAKFEIENAESLDNLPVMAIQVLADDQLTDAKKAELRTAWKSMTRKDLLLFIQAYAISTQFHNSARVKYYNSFDRHLILANRTNLKNAEQYAEASQVRWLNWTDQQRAFEPIHDVFGGQTGLETSNSTYLFQENYNGATESNWRFTDVTIDRHGIQVTKNWGAVIPAAQQANVKSIAEWLWNRLVADGGKNLGTLERAHLYALLAQGRDLAYVINKANVDKVYTEAELNTTYAANVNTLATATMALADPNIQAGRTANQRIGMAVNFIIATPFMLAQEGR